MHTIINQTSIIGVRGSPERDISSLRAFGPGGKAGFESCSRFGACAFRCFWRSVVFVMHEHVTVCRIVVFVCMHIIYLQKSRVSMH